MWQYKSIQFKEFNPIILTWTQHRIKVNKTIYIASVQTDLVDSMQYINMKNVIKFVKSVESLDVKLLNQLNVLWFLLI